MLKLIAMEQIMSPARTYLGRELRLARQKRAMTQRELCHQTEFSPPEISRWETGERMPSIPQFLVLCKALHADQCKLLVAAAKGVIKSKS